MSDWVDWVLHGLRPPESQADLAQIAGTLLAFALLIWAVLRFVWPYLRRTWPVKQLSQAPFDVTPVNSFDARITDSDIEPAGARIRERCTGILRIKNNGPPGRFRVQLQVLEH